MSDTQDRTAAEQLAVSAFAIGGEVDTKAASLLFQYVLPIGFGTFAAGTLVPDWGLSKGYHAYLRLRQNILGAIRSHGYEHLIKEEVHLIYYDGHEEYGLYIPVEGAESDINAALAALIDSGAHLPENYERNGSRTTFREWITSFNYDGVRAPFYGYDLAGGSDPEVNGILVTLTNVPWIDLHDTPWEQIFEFRKDKKSLKHFRTFRLFLKNTYVGKSETYIQDDFMRRLDEFEAARKKHGFELQTSVFKSVLNSKYILGGGLGGLIAWLFGAVPNSGVIGSAAMLAGVSVEIANVALDIRSASFRLKQMIDGAELGYVVRAKDALASSRGL